jgi:NTE family protein
MHPNLARDFSLVLSGGGALGIAQLGVIADLEEQGVVPQEIVGTSMGGIIGASLAIGLKEQQIYELFAQFANILNWIKFSITGNSVIKNDRLARIFDDIFGERTMSDVQIPLKLIATDIANGEIRVFDERDDIGIKEAVLATMAIPGVFEEQPIDGRIYVDGFIGANLGVLQASYEHIVAVDVLGKNSFTHAMPDNIFKTQNVLDMFEKSIRLLIYNQTKTAIEALPHKKILLIEPDTKAYHTFHFHKYQALRELGRGLLV